MCEQTKRYCYRCTNCLALFVSAEYISNCYVAECMVCLNKGVERMGIIGPDQRRKTEKIQCKCDNRCVWAKGPLCDCVCGGANHQSGYAGYTQVVIDNGIPRLTCTDLDTCLKHQAQATEYKELMDSVKNLPLDNVPNAGWYRRGTLHKAWKSRLHKHRVKVLNDFLEKYVKAA